MNVGYVTGRVSFPFAGPCSSSKSALAALTHSLRVEPRPWGISVSLVEAGNVGTPVWEKHLNSVHELLAGLSPEGRVLYEDALAADMKMVRRISKEGSPPEGVAEVVVHALTAPRPKCRYLAGSGARALAVITKFLPDRLRDLLVAKFMGLDIERRSRWRPFWAPTRGVPFRFKGSYGGFDGG